MAPQSLVTMTNTTVRLAISPTFLSNLKTGVEGQLSPNLNRYYPPLKAIMLGYDQLKLTTRTGGLMYDSPAVHITIQGRFFLFNPEIGSTLPGVVNKKSPGHLGCLVHDTFNVSLLAGDNERKVMWGFRSLPVIQGKLVTMEQVGKVEVEDYDSGIDSTLSQEQRVVKVKKSKKRKREVEEDDGREEKRIKEEPVEEEVNSSKKKKKKKRREESS